MGMSALEMTLHANMTMPALTHPTWDLSYFTLMLAMWWVMMIAMMLPGAAPVILLATALNRRSGLSVPPFGSTASFTAGYLLGWLVFSVTAVITQWTLTETHLITTLLRSQNNLLSAGLLITAGSWQWSPWKRSCLRHCRSPAEFLVRHRRPGNVGALMMGLEHSVFCLGCCWVLMTLLFVGGVMNLYWIAGLAVYILFEKLLPKGEILSKLVGVALIFWGVAVAFG